MVRYRHFFDDGDVLNRFVVVAVVADRRVLICDVYRSRVVGHLPMSFCAVVGRAISDRALPLVNRRKPIRRFHLPCLDVVGTRFQVGVIDVASGVKQAGSVNCFNYYAMSWYVKDRDGLEISRLRVVVRRECFNDQAVFPPFQDRCVLLIRRYPTVGMVSRVVGAVMIRTVHRRDHVLIFRTCVVTCLNGLNVSIVGRVIPVRGRNVPLRRLRVIGDFRQVHFLVRANAIAVRVCAIIARHGISGRGLYVQIQVRQAFLRRVQVRRVRLTFDQFLFPFFDQSRLDRRTGTRRTRSACRGCPVPTQEMFVLSFSGRVLCALRCFFARPKCLGSRFYRFSLVHA